MKKFLLLILTTLALSFPIFAQQTQQPAPQPNEAQRRIQEQAAPLIAEREQLLKKLHATVFSDEVDELLRVNDKLAQAQTQYQQAGEKPKVADDKDKTKKVPLPPPPPPSHSSAAEPHK